MNENIEEYFTTVYFKYTTNIKGLGKFSYSGVSYIPDSQIVYDIPQSLRSNKNFVSIYRKFKI